MAPLFEQCSARVSLVEGSVLLPSDRTCICLFPGAHVLNAIAHLVQRTASKELAGPSSPRQPMQCCPVSTKPSRSGAVTLPAWQNIAHEQQKHAHWSLSVISLA